MLVHCSNPDCSAQCSDDRNACPSCGSLLGQPVEFRSSDRPNRRNKRFLALFVIPAVAFAGCQVTTLLFSPFSGRVFDRDVWHAQAGSEDSDNPRASMVHHLKWRYLLPGTSRSTVIQVLGEPDWEKQADVYSYNVGMWSGFRIDYDSLDIHFRGDTVTHVRCVQH